MGASCVRLHPMHIIFSMDILNTHTHTHTHTCRHTYIHTHTHTHTDRDAGARPNEHAPIYIAPTATRPALAASAFTPGSGLSNYSTLV